MNFQLLHSDLTNRGLIKQASAGLTGQTSITGVYCGFDPTADSLHVGHLVGVRLLDFAQKWGIPTFALIGGATGMIGDPSGKKSERSLLDSDTIQKNVEKIHAQLTRLLPHTQVVNNLDWWKDVSVLDFMRDVGKEFTVSPMLHKQSVKTRLETGISFTEFAYCLFQAKDFEHLFSRFGCNLQIGGSDQWGNMIDGLSLISKFHEGEAHVLTTPLLTDQKGNKFGKSVGRPVWLDPKKTTPKKFYDFWYSQPDSQIEQLGSIFMHQPFRPSDLSTNDGELQFELASLMLEWVHDMRVSDVAEVRLELSTDDFPLWVWVKSLHKVSGNQARTLVKQGAVKIEGIVQKDPYCIPDRSDFGQAEVTLKIGKKHSYKVIFRG